MLCRFDIIPLSVKITPHFRALTGTTLCSVPSNTGSVTMTEPIYGEVNSPSDLTKINEEIRAEIRKADSRDKVTELKRRSRYLVTLLAPDNPTGLAEKLREAGKLKEGQKKAWEEYVKTTDIANEHRHGGEEYTVGDKPDYV